MGGLKSDQLERLALALRAHLALPTSTDLAPDACEAIFAWAVRGRLPVEALTHSKKRSKLLFDVTKGQIGWSLKTYMPSRLETGSTFEVVLARAAVESKAKRRRAFHAKDREEMIDLASAEPDVVGAAVLRVRRDVLDYSTEQQGVTDPREGMLLRSRDNREFVYFEHALRVEADEQVEWRWSSEDRLGLQGWVNGKIAYRWYQSGGQLFGCYSVPPTSQRFKIDWRPATWDELIEFTGRLS